MSIYMIRHAQSEFNAVFDQNSPDPMIFDAPLSALGRQQAIDARQHVASLEITNLIVSPFTRTLQTASLIFADKHPMEINPLVREQLTNSCDVGSPPSKLAASFPHLSFNHLQDCWWHDGEKDHRGISVEPDEVLQCRADEFVEFARQNNLHSTAIVSHGNFIHAVTGVHLKNCQIIRLDLDTAQHQTM